MKLHCTDPHKGLKSILLLQVVLILLETCSCQPTNEETSTGLPDEITAAPLYGAGKLFVAGGTSNSKSVDTLTGEKVPDLPKYVYGSSLTAVDSILYSCGGEYNSITFAECYSLDTKSLPGQSSWDNPFNLSIPMSYHSAVAVGTHIWFTFNGTIYDVDTYSPKSPYIKKTEFVDNGQHHCAVSNGAYSFIMGVGKNNDEIWQNDESFSLNSWHLAGFLSVPRIKFACVWMDDKIFVTGGDGTDCSAEMYEISTTKNFPVARLSSCRYSHGMFEFFGKAAVIGGYPGTGGGSVDTIEIYDPLMNASWTRSHYHLVYNRVGFGLAQIPA